MTISTKAKNNLIDACIIVVATVILIYLLPAVAGLFAFLSLKLDALRFGRTFFFIQYTILCDFLPYILTGILQGTVTMRLIRNRRLFIAVLPAIFLTIFFILYLSFGFPSLEFGTFWWRSSVSWTLLMCSSFLGALWVLKWRAKR